MIDFAVWDSLLHQYVDQQGRVDYLAWSQQPQALTNWLASLESVDLNPTLPADQLALWMNLYNAFTISTILKRYPIASIRPVVLGLPNWIAFLRFFQRRVYRFSNKTYSLNQIENDMLRDRCHDARIHFAIVCASIGCPLLRNEAYTSALVEHQLDNDAHRFINNPDKVRYDAQTGTLYCSKILKWYRQDFLQLASSIPDYICAYRQDLPLTASTPIAYLHYDWSLNQRTSS
ncbi:DUF547 domain-containing protein [Phormidium sp. CLA17]|uniref:DUF547 domain-containing protein n=1 Tax=Leptolyngbya sp. Cla-17 TaxID=2803751 RepID=UPI001490F3ED|nr:DUF547 domain-containing protein [Leptolyngbya sp. Cla-17]MBM0743438.1 DUF547 domain-containing protein [Leptolyngbya sp. Cla-17]